MSSSESKPKKPRMDEQSSDAAVPTTSDCAGTSTFTDLELQLQQELKAAITKYTAEGTGCMDSSTPQLWQIYLDDNIPCTEKCDSCIMKKGVDHDKYFSPDQLFNKAQDYFTKYAHVLQQPFYSNCVQVYGTQYCIRPHSSLKWLGSAATDASFLFIIHMPTLDLITEMSLLKFLLSGCAPKWHHTEESDRSLLSVINDSQNVLIAVYGLDEFSLSQQQSSENIPQANLHDKQNAWVFAVNLLCGNLLPNAKKVFLLQSPITKKLPTTQFDTHFRPCFTCYVTADSHKVTQDKVATILCKDKLDDYNKWNGNLMCTNCDAPLTFYLSVNYFLNHPDEQEGKSLTPIFGYACETMNSKSNMKELTKEMTLFTKFAWHNLVDWNKWYFSAHELQEFGVSQALVNILLDTTLVHDLHLPGVNVSILKDGPLRFSFPIWQEWFAAIALMLVIPEDEFHDATSKLAGERFHNVAKFAFGLSNKAMFKNLTTLVGAHSEEVWLNKVKHLKTYMFDKLKEMDQYNRAKMVLSLCEWTNECNSDEMRSDVVSAMGSRFFLYDGHVSVHAFAHLFSVIKLYEHSLDFELGVCSFGEHSLELLVDEISKLPHKATCLNINGSEELDCVQYVGKCLNNIQSLHLNECGLDMDGAIELAEYFDTLTTPLKTVHIELCFIRTPGCVAIAKHAHMIENLAMIDCGIGDPEDIEAIADEILKLEEPIKTLDLSKNDMQRGGVLPILKCLPKVERLILQECELEAEEINAIAEGIAELDQPIKFLDLSYNSIEPESGDVLDKCQHNVDHFHLDFHNLNAEQAAKIAHKMSGTGQNA